MGKSRTELEAIVKVIKSLTYYQILKVTPASSLTEIREAFHQEALDFHPDQYTHSSDPISQEMSRKIYERVVEAYRTLSQQDKRVLYDHMLDGGEISAPIIKETMTKKLGMGDRFYQLAAQAFQNKDFPSAKMNIEIALNAENENQKFLQLKTKVDLELQRRKK